MSKFVKTDSDSLDQKMQTEKNSVPAADVTDPSFHGDVADKKIVTKSTNPGNTLKQQTVAKVLESTTAGAPTVSGGTALRGSWRASSGSYDGALGTSQATPKGSDTRRDTRFGRKVEKVATKINFTPSEQYEKNYVEAPPLGQAPDKVQGYPGTYKNETYRTQKVSGVSPAELNYDRSVDFIEKDQVYFGVGQQILPSSEQYSYEPAEVFDVDAAEWQTNANKIGRCNFLPHDFNIRYGNANGEHVLTYFKINGIEANPTYDRSLAQAEADNAQTELNKIEVYREEMETKAGDEDKPGWSELPKAIHDPNGWLALFHAYEAMVGNETVLSRAKLATALSFFLNKAPKDGQTVTTPAIEAFLGALGAKAASTDFGETVSSIWSDSSIALGSAGAFIKAFDSVSKYNTKADFLLQPRSIKMHYQTALNNMDPLYCDPRFIKAFEKTEAFSTIDRDYDPTLPVYMTDKAGLVYPFNLGKVSEFACGNVKTQQLIVNEYTGAQATAGFKATEIGWNPTSSSKTIYYKRALIEGGTNDGSYTTSTDSTNKILYLVANSTTNGADAETLDISTTSAAGYSSLTLPAGYTLMVKAPLNSPVDYDTDLQPIGAARLTYGYKDRNNHYFVKVENPLVAGIIRYLQDNANSFATKCYYDHIKYTLPILHSTRYITLWDTLVCSATPYICQERVNSFRSILHYEDDHGYPFHDLVSVKDAGFPHYENFGFDSYESELKVGRMSDYNAIRWTMPEFFWDLGLISDSTVHKFIAPWYICESDYKQVSGSYKLRHKGYDGEEDTEFSMCWPSTREGIKLDMLTKLQGMDERELRLALDIIVDITNADTNSFIYPRAYKYGRATDGQVTFSVDGGLKIIDLLKMPRQLGFVMDAPGGLLTSIVGSNWSLTDLATTDYSGANSFRCYFYTNSKLEAGKTILAKDDMNVDRAANFKQVWHYIDVISPAGSVEAADFGVLLGISMAFDGGYARTGKAEFKPYGTFGAGAADDASRYPTLFATHRFLYARLQQLQFVISPFDAIDIIDGGSSHCDLYDFAYTFGLCGFRESNYDEDVYNRETEAFDKGFMFVEDPWYTDSVLSK